MGGQRLVDTWGGGKHLKFSSILITSDKATAIDIVKSVNLIRRLLTLSNKFGKLRPSESF